MPAPVELFARPIQLRFTECENIADRRTGYASTGKLCRGWKFHANSWQADAALVIDEQLELPHVTSRPAVVASLTKLRRNITTKTLRSAIRALEGMVSTDIVQRLYIYVICSGGCMPEERARVASIIAVIDHAIPGPDQYWLTATMLGVMQSSKPSMDAYFDVGSKILSELVRDWKSIGEATTQGVKAALGEHDEAWDDLLEDRAEIRREHEPGVIVVPEFELPAPSAGDRARIRRDFHAIAGKRLPLVPTGDVSEHMRVLGDAMPHLVPAYDRLLRDTAMSPHARFQPWILVGEPGVGKTSMAVALAETIGVPFTVFDAGSSADGTFAGTAAHWSTSGPSLPTRACLVSGKANPLIIIDEIEKAASSTQNGALHHALLGFLEPGNARRYRDPALELPVDLSHVSYILTANSLEGIPPPLRDRCKIIRVPDPEPQHIGSLVKTIVRDIIRRQGIDPAWYPPLAEDEIEIVKEFWDGGSMRRLREVVQAALDFRAEHMGRA